MLSKLTCLSLEENRQHFQVFKKGKNVSSKKMIFPVYGEITMNDCITGFTNFFYWRFFNE